MELKDFVSKALKDIIDGVSDAQEYAAKRHAEINPYGYVANQANPTLLRHFDDYKTAQLVEFDVAVTATEGAEVRAGIGAALSVLVIGVQGRADARDTTANRIQFSVPLALPQREPDKQESRTAAANEDLAGSPRQYRARNR
jgi:hypothetical protein